MVFLEMVLAALLGDASEHRPQGLRQASMIVAGNQAHAAQSALNRALQKGALADFCLSQTNHMTPKNAPFTLYIHGTGNQYGHVRYLPIHPHFLVADIQKLEILSRKYSNPKVVLICGAF